MTEQTTLGDHATETSGESAIIALVGCLALVVGTAGISKPLAAQPDAGATSAEEVTEQTESNGPPTGSPGSFCREYIADFARSSARKLFRALTGQGFTLQPIGLGNTIDLEATTENEGRETVTFEVLTENDEKVAGFVDQRREYRRILIAASTQSGPIVASQLWPVPGEVSSDAACRPSDSQIAVPPLTLGDIDIEPFKFWGLRVVWRLPHGYTGDNQGSEALKDALRDALKQDIDS